MDAGVIPSQWLAGATPSPDFIVNGSWFCCPGTQPVVVWGFEETEKERHCGR